METPESASESLSNADKDKRIREDVRRLALQHKDSRSLTLEVCRLLFYRYGEVPNANRVYNLTRKGSLTTITEQVAAFWLGIRGQTHVRIPCPGLAEEAADKLGSFLSGLIQDIEVRLQGQLDAHRDAARDEVRTARLAADQATVELQAAKLQARQDKQMWETELHAAGEREAELLGQLAAERATAAHLKAEAETWTARTAEAQSQLRHAQEMFTREIASLRDALALSESRAAGAEQRALERIEEERGEQRKLAARLAQAEKHAESQATKAEAMTGQILALTSEAATLKGKLTAIEQERERLLVEIDRLIKFAGPTNTRPRVRRRPQADGDQPT